MKDGGTVADHEETSTAHQLGALFSTTATDNAEVVPPVAHHGPDHMWSTHANTAGTNGDGDGAGVDDTSTDQATDPPVGKQVNGSAAAVDEDVPGGPHTSAHSTPDEAVDGEFIDDSWHGAYDHAASRPGDPWVDADGPDAHSERSLPPRDRSTGVFSAEPVSRYDDVLDEDDGTVHRNGPGRHEPSPWSSEPTVRQRATFSDEPLFASRADHSAPADPWISARFDEQADDAADPNGLRAAVSRLDPRDVETAAVPIAVCGALLTDGEEVQGAVTGQMLGRPAVVVLTDSRVLIVNDRRWQPIVDVFPVDAALVVRGRHDRNVAALSFADATRLAMVDGITEVALAIDMAERIRSIGSA